MKTRGKCPLVFFIIKTSFMSSKQHCPISKHIKTLLFLFVCQHKSASFLLKSRLLSPWVTRVPFQTELGQQQGLSAMPHTHNSIWNAICPLSSLFHPSPCFLFPSLSDVARVLSSICQCAYGRCCLKRVLCACLHILPVRHLVKRKLRFRGPRTLHYWTRDGGRNITLNERFTGNGANNERP